MKSELIHFIYASAASPGFKNEDLAPLLKAARENNAARGLTGMLLYAESSFFQVLEGPEAVVDDLYARIERDQRHTRVTMIIREPIPKRHFDAWTMGFYQVTREELAGMSGINDFFEKNPTAVSISSGRAKKLLAAFREGRWRTKLSDPLGTAPT